VSKNFNGISEEKSASVSVIHGGASSFAMGFISSEAFKALFKEGMGLVEDAAAYLDGQGRAEAKALPRMIGLAYAAESMRLTTRLMQIASWLLLQRAVVEGEMTVAQARKERNKVDIIAESSTGETGSFDDLPDDLKSLVARSLRLQARIAHLDRILNDGDVLPEAAKSPVATQMQMLQSAFSGQR
jgi:regulator of CtrA degradation